MVQSGRNVDFRVENGRAPEQGLVFPAEEGRVSQERAGAWKVFEKEGCVRSDRLLSGGQDLDGRGSGLRVGEAS